MARHAPPPSRVRRALAAVLAWRPPVPRPLPIAAPRALALAAAALTVVSVVALVVAPHPHVDTRKPIAGASPSTARSEGTRLPRYSPAVLPSIDASGAYDPDAPSSSSSASATPAPAATHRPTTRTSTASTPTPTAAPPAADPPPVVDPPPDTGTATPQPAVAAGLAELVNRDRLANGCGPVTVDPGLVDQSQTWSEQQAHDEWMRHSAGGFGGENVAAGQRTADEVHADWMASPGHRANILDCSFTRIGFGAADSASDVRYWTEQFE